MSNRQDQGGRRLDDAARAGWLYYVAGNNQEEIAKKLNVSRQTAQRLVSLSVSEGLIKVRLDHPIGRCMELAEKLRQRFALDHVEVVPSDPESTSTIVGIAQAAAAEIERRLRAPAPITMAIGTGRTLKAAIEQLTPMEAPQHKIVSLTGNIAPDGSASYYNVIFNMADAVKARMFPMPLPVIASSANEREMLLKTLAASGNNKRRAARSLGITTKTIYNRLLRYRSLGLVGDDVVGTPPDETEKAD